MPDRLLVDLDGDGQATVLWSSGGGLPEAVSRVPLVWPLDTNAQEDLRWYLEDYLLAPFGVWEEHGAAIRERLAGWGDAAFECVFGSRPARDAYQRAKIQGLELVLRSAEPGLLGLPWELMRDGAGPIALGAGGISRSLPVAGSTKTLEVPGGALRVLMVIARPAGTDDVGYQMVARPLLDRLDAVRGQVDLTVLRPPTFGALRLAVTQAADAGEPFHVVHFDGHGGVAAWTGEGVLAFELPGGGSGYVAASKVAAVLAQGRVPVVVLNACQSGAVGKELEASVATALLQAGCAAVVAMAYSVYAVAAAEFMAAFYELLFTGASVGQAVTAGRRRLFEHDGRPSPRGNMPLADWVVPVHYMRREVRFPQARTTRPAGTPSLDSALDQIRAAPSGSGAVQDPLAATGGIFVGRDDLFFQLESAARLQRVVVLFGPGGTGKTELAKGFARWWRDTCGVDDPGLVFWHSFEPGAASSGLDGVITTLGLAAFGAEFALLEVPQRLDQAKRLLAQLRVLLVWDNFESVKEMPDPARVTPPLDGEGCAALKEFLDWVREHSRSTVLLTSRTQEEWLGPIRRVGVGGLNRAEAAEYAGHLLAPFPAAQRKRERRSFGELLEWLDGHPLAMRLTLPRLEGADPEGLLATLKGTIPLPVDELSAGRNTSLPASITYSYVHLSGEARRLLPAVSLFHGMADEGVLAVVSTSAGVPGRLAGVSREEWKEVLQEAVHVGLLTSLGVGMYRIHPALPSYLAVGWHAEDPASYAAEREACEQALCTAVAAFSVWLTRQIESGDAALAYATIGLQRQTLGAMLAHALDHQAWANADGIVRALYAYYDNRGFSGELSAWADRILETTAGLGQALPDPGRSLWLYTIVKQASMQRDQRHFDQAVQTYRRALAYLQDQPETEWTRSNVSVLYHQLGITAKDCGQLDQAEDWYRKAVAISEEFNLRSSMAAIYEDLGSLTQTRGQLDQAEDWYRKALAIKEEIGNLPLMATAYHQLGITAESRGHLEQAQDWYRKALVISEELGNRPYMAATYYQLGRIAYLGGQLDQAEDWYRKTLPTFEEFNNRLGLATVYHQFGNIFQDRRQLDEADSWYRRSLAINKELDNRPGMALTYAQLGLLAEARGQALAAMQWDIQSVTLFDQFPSLRAATGTIALVRLTRQLGINTLQATWQQVTGQPIPQTVRNYIASHQDEQPRGAL